MLRFADEPVGNGERARVMVWGGSGVMKHGGAMPQIRSGKSVVGSTSVSSGSGSEGGQSSLVVGQ